MQTPHRWPAPPGSPGISSPGISSPGISSPGISSPRTGNAWTVNSSTVSAWTGSAWIAATGLSLVLFLVFHLGGVLLAVLQPEAFTRWVALLHSQVWLPAAEGALLLMALVHVVLVAAKVWSNRLARAAAPPGRSPGLASRRGDPLAALAARTSPWSGGLLLVFLLVHLRQLRWPRPLAGLDLQAVQAALATPWAAALYGLAALALAIHLLHGSEAAHRSLGLLDPGNGLRIRHWGRLLALGLGLGFLAASLALSPLTWGLVQGGLR